MEEMKTLFNDNGYTSYDLNSFKDDKITRMPEDEYPIVLISRGLEVMDNDASPIDFLVEDAEIRINVILDTGLDEYEADVNAELRKVKDIIYSNRNKQSFWCKWLMIDNFNAQLQSTNTHSKVFGGININTSVNYRENEIQGVL